MLDQEVRSIKCALAVEKCFNLYWQLIDIELESRQLIKSYRLFRKIFYLFACQIGHLSKVIIHKMMSILIEISFIQYLIETRFIDPDILLIKHFLLFLKEIFRIII